MIWNIVVGVYLGSTLSIATVAAGSALYTWVLARRVRRIQQQEFENIVGKMRAAAAPKVGE